MTSPSPAGLHATRIMYVAVAAVPKPFKVDNINGKPSRRWNGLGDVVTVAVPLEAQRLLQHPMMFEDVTALDEQGILSRVAELQDLQRAERRANAKNSIDHALANAAVEDLEEELRRRRGSAGRVVPTTAPEDLPKTADLGSTQKFYQPKRASANGRPQSIEDLQADVLGAIMRLDPVASFGPDKKPYLEHVVAILDYPVTQEELDIVYSAVTPEAAK